MTPSTRTLLVFVSAFILNFLWEHAHSALYVSYQGGAITTAILLRAALFDAAVIAFSSYPFLRFERLRRREWLLYVGLFVFAVLLEMWALSTGRWVYADAMPIIPFLGIGLTPVIQLWLLGYAAVSFANYPFNKKTASHESTFAEKRR